MLAINPILVRMQLIVVKSQLDPMPCQHVPLGQISVMPPSARPPCAAVPESSTFPASLSQTVIVAVNIVRGFNDVHDSVSACQLVAQPTLLQEP